MNDWLSIWLWATGRSTGSPAPPASFGLPVVPTMQVRVEGEPRLRTRRIDALLVVDLGPNMYILAWIHPAQQA